MKSLTRENIDTSGDFITEIRRPEFLAGKKTIRDMNTIRLPPNRRDYSLYEINRPSFISSRIFARKPVELATLIAQDEELHGSKIQIGDKTIDQLFKVRVPDPSDTTFVAEGRLQRTMEKTINFGQSNLDVNDAINAMTSAVAANKVESNTQRTNMALELARILGNQKAIEDLNVKQLEQISVVTKRLNIKQNWKQAGLPKQVYTSKEFRNNAAAIIMFILTNTRGTPLKPVLFLNPDNKRTFRTLSVLWNMGLTKTLYIQNSGDATVIPIRTAINITKGGIDNSIVANLYAPLLAQIYEPFAVKKKDELNKSEFEILISRISSLNLEESKEINKEIEDGFGGFKIEKLFEPIRGLPPASVPWKKKPRAAPLEEKKE